MTCAQYQVFILVASQPCQTYQSVRWKLQVHYWEAEIKHLSSIGDRKRVEEVVPNNLIVYSVVGCSIYDRSVVKMLFLLISVICFSYS